MCKGCGGEEEFLNYIQIWADKRDEYLFVHVDIGRRGGCPRGRRQYFGPTKEYEGEFLTIDGNNVDE